VNQVTNKKVIFLVLSVAVFCGLASLVLFAYIVWRKPLGPSLANIPFEVPLSTITIEGQSPPLCGDTPTLTILLAGIDYRGDEYLYGLADVIRIVRIDFTQPKVSIFALDRAIWVEIPGIQDHYGITHGLLNQAYFYGVPAMGYYDGPAGGAGLLAQTLNYNFGLNVDHYVVVSFAAFTQGIDALGGIDVYLPEPVDGTGLNGEEGLGYFEAGWHHLDGQGALNLARIRQKYSSLDRITNQDAIIQGIYDKLTSPEVIIRIPELIQTLQDTVLTDLSPRQINDIYCLSNYMSTTDLTFAEIPESYYIPSIVYSPEMHADLFIYDIDFSVIRSYVNDFQNGIWP
jgi:LCP family protein required for cell wall assembly